MTKLNSMNEFVNLLLPEGGPGIAQRFNTRNDLHLEAAKPRRDGRSLLTSSALARGNNSAVPGGTFSLSIPHIPALKRRAILFRPAGLRRCYTFAGHKMLLMLPHEHPPPEASLEPH